MVRKLTEVHREQVAQSAQQVLERLARDQGAPLREAQLRALAAEAEAALLLSPEQLFVKLVVAKLVPAEQVPAKLAELDPAGELARELAGTLREMARQLLAQAQARLQQLEH